MSEEFTDVKFSQKVTYDVPPHEILLSFVSDNGARDFHRWWHKEGSKLFQEWLDSQ